MPVSHDTLPPEAKVSIPRREASTFGVYRKEPSGRATFVGGSETSEGARRAKKFLDVGGFHGERKLFIRGRRFKTVS